MNFSHAISYLLQKCFQVFSNWKINWLITARNKVVGSYCFYTRVSFCSQGDLCPGGLCPSGSLSREVSVQRVLSPGGSLSKGGLCPGESLSEGLCPGGLCPGESLSRGVFIHRGLCPGDLCSVGSLSGRPPPYR